MKKRIHRFFLDGDYEGLWFEANVLIPHGEWLGLALQWEEEWEEVNQRLQEAIARQQKPDPHDMRRNNRLALLVQLHTLNMLKKLVTGWNLTDFEGQPISLEEKGFDSLPKELIDKMWGMVADYVQTPPKVGGPEPQGEEPS